MPHRLAQRPDSLNSELSLSASDKTVNQLIHYHHLELLDGTVNFTQRCDGYFFHCDLCWRVLAYLGRFSVR